MLLPTLTSGVQKRVPLFFYTLNYIILYLKFPFFPHKFWKNANDDMPSPYQRHCSATTYAICGTPVSAQTDLSVIGDIISEPSALYPSKRARVDDYVSRDFFSTVGLVYFPPYTYKAALLTGGALQLNYPPEKP